MWQPLLDAHEGVAVAVVGVADAERDRLAEYRPEADLVRTTNYNFALEVCQPDVVIIASPDFAHQDQIVSALNIGVCVVSEKPMCLSDAESIRVLAALDASDAALFVAHNFRYVNVHETIKSLLDEGAIGRPVQVMFTYHLSRAHGKSYLERWHRRHENSGGLQITKATHHFDLFNWWLDSGAREVVAFGGRRYFRDDADVPTDADIGDSIDCLIRYEAGAVVSYSLRGASSWEGYELSIAGTEGTISTKFLTKTDPVSHATEDHRIEIRSMFGKSHVLRIPRESGGHGGADARLANRLFQRSDLLATIRELSNAQEAARAVSIGDAVTRSIRSRASVLVASTCQHS